jgi:hypothetical protein
MKNCKKRSQCVLASLLSVLSSGCCLNVKAREKVAINQNVQNQNVQKGNSSSLPNHLITLGAAAGVGYFAYIKLYDIFRRKIWVGSEELKGVNLSKVIENSNVSWILDHYEVSPKDLDVTVEPTYEKVDGKSINFYTISGKWPGRKSTKKDLLVFPQNQSVCAVLPHPVLLGDYDLTFAIERSGYGMASDDIDVPKSAQDLYDSLDLVMKKLPKNDHKKEVLCFSMGGAETSALMKNEEIEYMKILSPVDLHAYLDGGMTYAVLSLLFEKLNISWSENMVDALQTRQAPLTIDLYSGDMTDKLCVVKSLMHTAERRLDWKRPDNWDNLSIQDQADSLAKFYHSHFPKLTLNVTIIKNMTHEGNVMLNQEIFSWHASDELNGLKPSNSTPGGEKKMYFDYLIEHARHAEKKKGESSVPVDVNKLQELFRKLKEERLAWNI